MHLFPTFQPRGDLRPPGGPLRVHRLLPLPAEGHGGDGAGGGGGQGEVKLISLKNNFIFNFLLQVMRRDYLR